MRLLMLGPATARRRACERPVWRLSRGGGYSF